MTNHNITRYICNLPHPYNKIGDGPEGPEVRLTTEFLNNALADKIIFDLTFYNNKYIDKQLKNYEEFKTNLPLLVESVQCKGKFIYFTLYNENNYFYILHSLRMTGCWQYKESDHCHLSITFFDHDPDKTQTLWFRDTRVFGTFLFTTDINILEKALSKLGPDILSPNFNLVIWKNIIKTHTNKNITALLMDQSIISGCGNYIKSESLYYANISPLRKASSLTEREIELLYEALTIIPRLSYNYKGVSLRDYKDAYGRNGSYSNMLKIYGNKDAKRTKTADGRTTYWNPEVQK